MGANTKLNLPKHKALLAELQEMTVNLGTVKRAFGKRMPRGIQKSITAFGRIQLWLETNANVYEEIVTAAAARPAPVAKSGTKTRAARA